MFEFIEVARGIQVLYKYAKEEILELDFFELQPSDYQKLPEESQDQKWFMINPEKLNENYFAQNDAFIVSEGEKYSLLKAVKFINLTVTTEKLPVDSSFSERLFYTKSSLPPVLFSDSSKKTNGNCKIIQLYDKKDN
jgi:hypothetical protein